MEFVSDIEKMAMEADSLQSLLLAVIDAAYNGSYNTKDYEEVFYYLCDMAYKQSQCLEELKEKSI